MLFTTDDFSPFHLDYFKTHIEPIRKEHPNFKILCFTVKHWHHESKSEDLKRFVDYCRKNKDWLYLSAHAMYHEVAEGLEQHELMIELRNWMNNLKVAGCSVIDAYKPPFYRYDYGTLDRAKRLYFKWLFLPSGILNINTDKFYKREGIGLIDSHCNPESKLLLADGKEILDPNRLELKPFEEYLKNYCDLSWLK